MITTTRIQPAVDEAANWTSQNPVLALGEMGYESDTKNYKIGDGITAWNSLAYFYQVGSWTPALEFGGASVGITYAASGQLGEFEKFGALVNVRCYVLLTSKGSSVGSAKITGLPFMIVNTNPSYTIAALYLNTVTFANQFTAFGEKNANSIALREVTEAGVLSDLSNSDFANTSQVVINMAYKTTY